jgi:sulfite reductase beta subunit-like hemoprotein
VPVCHATLTAFRDFGARQNRQKTRVMYVRVYLRPGRR